MCFSAEAWADYREYVREFGAELDIAAFVRLYGERGRDNTLKTPKAMDAAMAHVAGTNGDAIRRAIADYEQAEATRLEQLLFAQSKRLADAQRSLQTKTTKKALNDQRIAGDKISASWRTCVAPT